MQEFILDNDGCAFKRKMPKIKVHEREEAPVSIGNDDQHFAISSSRLPATSRNILFFYSQGYHLFMSSKDTFQTSIMG